MIDFQWVRQRALRPGRTAIALSLAALLPASALAQTVPDFGGATATQCIPFANPQPVAFTNAPRLNFSIAGSATVHSVQMDTGSVGVAMSYDLIPNYDALKTRKGATAGTQFLSSSKILWAGTWVPVAVTLYDAKKEAVATAEVLVLGVENAGTCASYQQTGQVCSGLPSAAGKGILYMGVGFGQEADFQPQGTPDKNVLLNLTSIGGKEIAAGSLNKGYIIGRQGIQVGLTAANAAGFAFAKLTPYAQYPGDWMPPAACITVNPDTNRNADGPICSSGTVLVDTGIPQSYMTVPTDIKFSTVQQADASEPSRQIAVLAPGTAVAVNIPGLPNLIATDAFAVGGGTPVEPVQVIPWSSDQRPPFINTGRHVLRQFQFLYDAANGYIGLKDQPNPCGEP